jgi:hypothetical protein
MGGGGVTGRFDDRVQLLPQCRGLGQLAEENVHRDPLAQGEWQHGQRAGLPGGPHEPGGEQFPRVTVEQVRGGDAGVPEPVQPLLNREVVVAERLQRSLQQRRGRGVAVVEPHRQAVQQEIGRERVPGPRVGGTRSLCRLPHADPAVERPREHRRQQRVQVGLARQVRVEVFELLRSAQQQGRSLPAAVQREGDLRALQVHPGALQLVQWTRLRQRQQSEGLVGCAGQICGLRCGERTLRAVLRIDAQLERTSQEGSGRGQPAARLGAPG